MHKTKYKIAKRKKIPFLISELKLVEERKFNIPGTGKIRSPIFQKFVSSLIHLNIKKNVKDAKKLKPR
jgi:hypothetical protein